MIDTDIFQIVTLVLLLLALLVSLVTLSTLGKIRKQMDSGAGASSAAGSTGWAEPIAAAAPAAQAQPAATSHPLEQGGYAGAAAAQPSRTQAAPSQAAAAQPAAGQPAAATPAAVSEPEEQPFERDGRWWFKRGDELLVYEESTGQWQPAGSAGGGTAPMPAAGGVATGTEVGAHWKCPTCGAVNGSTAATCRMCFTPRP